MLRTADGEMIALHVNRNELAGRKRPCIPPLGARRGVAGGVLGLIPASTAGPASPTSSRAAPRATSRSGVVCRTGVGGAGFRRGFLAELFGQMPHKIMFRPVRVIVASVAQ